MAQDQNQGGYQVAAAGLTAMGNYAAQVANNKRQWRYQQAAMDKQQQMNIDAWNMENAYNSPQQNMQRLQDAGLNPRLIYGDGGGAGGNAGPLQPADAPVRQANQPPDLMQYYQIRQMDAQYKQTTAATEIMQKTSGLKDIEQALNNLKLLKEKEFAPNYQIHAVMQNDLEKWVSMRAKVLLENEQRKGHNLLRQGDLMDQLGQMRKKQTTTIDLDNAFKEHRNELAKVGIYTTDHPAFRVLIQAAKRMDIDLGELLKEGTEGLQYLLDLKK